MAPQSAEPVPLNLFYSYSHKDEELRDELETHLASLKNDGVIHGWHDRQITPGQEWDGKIDERLNSADIILLLVSPDFLASKYCYDIEVRRALERHETGEACVVPIILRPCDWQRAPFSKLQALPVGAVPVTRWPDRDEAFLNVTGGIRRAVEELLSVRENLAANPCEEISTPSPVGPAGEPDDDWRVHIPVPPPFGFVPRRDRKGHDIVGHLVAELAPGRRCRLVLSGPGAAGKTTIAAEAARTLLEPYEGLVVWSDAAGRVNYTASSLFEDITITLGGSKPHRRPFDRKKAEADVRIAGRTLLVVIDSYEKVLHEERESILDWLAGSAHSALFISRERETYFDLDEVHVLPMWRDEAQELLGRLIDKTQSPELFTSAVRKRILDAAGGIPLALKWLVAQTIMTKRPAGGLEKLRRGKGKAADRAFNNAFTLPQLGDDGRAALLALSLFTPSAAHEALAYVAGFGRNARALERLDGAATNLTRLWLLREGDTCDRLGLEDLTRTLAGAALAQDGTVGGFKFFLSRVRRFFLRLLSKETREEQFKRRFIGHFVQHAVSFKWAKYADRTVPQAERSNVVAAMQFAFERKDWDTVLELFAVTLNYVNTYPLWRQSVLAAEREAENFLKKGRPPLLIEINHRYENKREARSYYEGIPGKLGVKGLASHADLIGFDPFRAGLRSSGKNTWKLVVLSVVAFELGVCARYRAKYQRSHGERDAAKRLSRRSRDYFEAAKRLKLAFNDYGGYAIACNNLGLTLAAEGLAGEGEEGWKAKALTELDDARNNFKKAQAELKENLKKKNVKYKGEYEEFEKVAERNIKWLTGLEG